MRIKRTLPVLIAVLAIAAAVVAIVQLRKRAPPEAVRLLPGADGFFYINLKWIRTFNATNQLPPVSRDPEYQKFVEETGLPVRTRPRRGRRSPSTIRGSWGGRDRRRGAEPRFSEIFVGKIDAGRLTAYLKKIASSVDDYKGFDIYNVPIEGRTVRVAVLSTDSVAVSNHPDENVIRGILDRSRKLASPFGGPQFLRQYYKKVPVRQSDVGDSAGRSVPDRFPRRTERLGVAVSQARRRGDFRTLSPRPASAGRGLYPE